MRKQCTDSIECELSCVDKMGDRVLEFNQYLLHCVSSEYLLDTLEIHTGYNKKAIWAVLCGQMGDLILEFTQFLTLSVSPIYLHPSALNIVW